MNDVRTVGCNPPTTETGAGIRWVLTHPTMTWAAMLLACCLIPAADSFADATHVEEEDGLTIIRLEVTPADEPVPAFKHRLMFDAHERLPGNRPQWYMRIYPEETAAWRKWREAMSSEDETGFESCYTAGVPVSEVDWQRFKIEQRIAGSLLDTYIVPGTLRRDSDWGIRGETLRGPETISFLLPELQGMREVARMTNLQVRWSVSEGQYKDAISYMRTGYQLGRDVAEEPFLVSGLVGIAITGIVSEGMTDLIAAPDSPNMYWALSELPSPPVSITEALNADLAFPERVFPLLSHPETDELTPAEWNAAWSRLARQTMDGTINSPKTPQKRLLGQITPTLFSLAGYTHAKERLADWGYTPEAVEAMAVGQILALYSARVYRIAADEHRKVMGVPFEKSRRIGDAAYQTEKNSRVLSDEPNREVVPIIEQLLPASSAAIGAEMRVARDLAALRVIEALRMHAARNGGKWPRTLAEVTCVPVPNNPATDKPFLYHLENGKTAVLDLPDWEGFPGYSRRYEIMIKP